MGFEGALGGRTLEIGVVVGRTGCVRTVETGGVVRIGWVRTVEVVRVG